MKKKFLRSGFTLVEVNLAIFIMAVGVLSVCSLYSLGFRENSQSVEDVNATAYADAVLAPLVAALSSPQLKWSDWKKIDSLGGNVSGRAQLSGIDGRFPANGWADYIERRSLGGGSSTYRVKSNPKGQANDVYQKFASAIHAKQTSMDLPSDLQAGLVVTRRGSVIQIALRLARKTQSLMAQPAIVTEVNYQGGFAKDGGGE